MRERTRWTLHGAGNRWTVAEATEGMGYFENGCDNARNKVIEQTSARFVPTRCGNIEFIGAWAENFTPVLRIQLFGQEKIIQLIGQSIMNMGDDQSQKLKTQFKDLFEHLDGVKDIKAKDANTGNDVLVPHDQIIEFLANALIYHKILD